MPSRFAASAAKLAGAVDRQFAEPLRIEPRAVGTWGASPDQERAPLDLQGVLIVGSAERQFTAGDRQNARFQGRIAVGEALAMFDIAALGGLLVRKGDRIVATGRPGSPAYEVSEVADPTLSRIVFRLVRA